VGFTVKSGWAAAVLVAGSTSTPRVLDSRRIPLSDPALPESRQPYHAGFGLARTGGAELERLVASVQRFGRQTVTGLIRRYRDEGFRLAGAGIVVGSLTDPDRIGNAHIRIHAQEGRLFRLVVEQTVRRARLPRVTWRERDLSQAAADGLALGESALRRRLTQMSEGVDGPWRVEQKAAALAAWLVLVGMGRAP
jgi:hypothetical protein